MVKVATWGSGVEILGVAVVVLVVLVALVGVGRRSPRVVLGIELMRGNI